MKIVVVGLGYVGLSSAVLLAQHNEVIGVDISQDRVSMLNARKSPIIDTKLSQYLVEKELHLSASTDLKTSVNGADYVIISTPTNYDEETNLKYDQEDFAGIMGITPVTHGENYKYDVCSYLDCAKMIKKYVASSIVSQEDFFKRIILNYLICNHRQIFE